VSSTLEERIQAIVHEQHRDQLAELVREVVDRELQALVEAELAARNGNGSTAQAANPLQETRHCRGCDRDLPASAFERGRHMCRACRRQQERDRERQRKAAADDVP